MDRKRLIDSAAGRRKSDLVLKNGKIVNVFTHEVIQGTLAVDQGVIVGIGPYEGETEIDLEGHYVLPGLIDSHVHLESALVSPEQFARLVVPRGTTTVIADPHEIANVCGETGIRYMRDAAGQTPLTVRFMVPSCVPATPFENSGAVLDAPAIKNIIGEDGILGLGEMMDYPGVIAGDMEILKKLETAHSRGMPVDGHGPMIEGRELTAYRAGGIHTDHECSTIEEMRDRLRLGMRILIREGSAARNLADLMQGVTPYTSRRCSFCTDDKQPEDILHEGHIDYNIRLAVGYGLDPLTAIQMATINAAEGYGLKNKGALSPGYDADIVVVNNLRDFAVEKVYCRGILSAEKGEPLFEPERVDSSAVASSVNIPALSEKDFALPLKGDLVNVIHVHPGSLITEKAVRKIDRNSVGDFQHNPLLDILKIAVIERHKKRGTMGLGLVEGYGLKDGAIGISIAHDSHNLIILGDNDRDMLAAAKELERRGGGMTLVRNGKALDTLPLPIAGLMSDQTAIFVQEKLAQLNRLAAEKLHVNPDLDAFMTLSFLALPVIPELKITDLGLFDVTGFKRIDINA